jgi:hypothetical protein
LNLVYRPTTRSSPFRGRRAEPSENRKKPAIQYEGILYRDPEYTGRWKLPRNNMKRNGRAMVAAVGWPIPKQWSSRKRWKKCFSGVQQRENTYSTKIEIIVIKNCTN